MSRSNRYTLYALATDKGPVHGWQPALDLGATQPYAPRDLSDLSRRIPAAWQSAATAAWLITNAGPAELPPDGDWTIVPVGPAITP